MIIDCMKQTSTPLNNTTYLRYVSYRMTLFRSIMNAIEGHAANSDSFNLSRATFCCEVRIALHSPREMIFQRHNRGTLSFSLAKKHSHHSCSGMAAAQSQDTPPWWASFPEFKVTSLT